MNSKKILPYLFINILSYLVLPLLIFDTSSAILILIIALPVILATTSFIYGYKEGEFNYLYCIITSFLFIIPISLYMNSSALIYIIIYLLITALFNSLGKVANKKC